MTSNNAESQKRLQARTDALSSLKEAKGTFGGWESGDNLAARNRIVKAHGLIAEAVTIIAKKIS